jgi:4-hydroxybenzoate polyprenyltransferase
MTECECPNIYRKMDFPIESIVKKITNVKRFIVNEFVYGGHWLSLSASSMALTFMLILNLSIKWEFLLISYLGTQCIYNYNHYKEIDIDNLSDSPRVKHLNEYKNSFHLIIKLYGVFYAILLVFFGNYESIVFGFFLLFLGLFYTYKTKDYSKNVAGFKSFYTAFAWGLLMVFTVLYCSFPITVSVFLLFIFVFLRLILSTCYFDIKDISADKESGILTFATSFKNKLFLLLHILNIISFIPIFIGLILGLLPIYSSFMLLLFFYSLYYIENARNKKKDITFLSYIVVDGEYNFWPIIVIAGQLVTGIL